MSRLLTEPNSVFFAQLDSLSVPVCRRRGRRVAARPRRDVVRRDQGEAAQGRGVGRTSDQRPAHRRGNGDADRARGRGGRHRDLASLAGRHVDRRRRRPRGDRPRGRPAAAGRAGPQEALPDLRRRPAQADRHRVRRRRRRLRDHARRDLQPRRRVGLRQDDARPHGHPADAVRPTAGSCSTATSSPTWTRTTCGPCAAGCRSSSRTRSGRSTRGCPISDIIGEGLLAQGLTRPQGARQARRGRARARRPPARVHPPLPARVLGRPAAAHRRRPGARARAGLHRRGRAGVGARRVDPEPGPEPAARPQARPQPDLPVHQPQPVGRPVLLATGSGSCTSARSPRSARSSSCTRNPRHPYTVALLSAIPDRRPPAPQEAPRAQGRRAVAGRAAVRLPVPHPLLAARAPRQPRELRRPIEPELVQFGDEAGHRVACHWADEISQATVAQAEAETPAVVAAAVDDE